MPADDHRLQGQCHGRPAVFMVNKPVNPGLLTVFEQVIFLRLEQELSVQSILFALEDNQPPRFILVFEQEGYSPDFMARIRAKGSSCLTYNKFSGVDWPEP